MAAGPNGLEEWVGSAYLFVESSLDKVVLSDAYAHQQLKVAMYRALRTALAGVWLGRHLGKKGGPGAFCGQGQRLRSPPLQPRGLVFNHRFEEKIPWG